MKWFVVFVVQKSLSAIMDVCVTTFASRFEKLHTVDYDLSLSDRVCLMSNSIVETLFVSHIVHLARELPVTTPMTLPSILLLFLMDDAIYAPFHYLLHTRHLYKYIHARHHRIRRPSLSYIHATLEHPVEMIGALLLHLAMMMVLWPLLCRVSVFAHLVTKAVLACLNHCGRDVQILWYRTQYHDIHHHRYKVNFSQYSFAWDRVMGTFCGTA